MRTFARMALTAGLAAVAVPWSALPAGAAGDLLVTPTRVVFEGRDRVAAVSITNTGLAPATYRISLVRRRMTEEGAFEDVRKPRPDERFADEMVRFSPRQIVLPPGVAQNVRLRLLKPQTLEAGEYRAHLLFRAVPTDGPQSAHQLTGEEKTPLQIQMTPIYGVTIPVLVRHGETQAAVTVSELAVRDGTRLRLRLSRTGNRSVYGDLQATYVPAEGQAQPVGQLKGLAVYTPNAARLVELPLKGPLGPGTLRVTFSEKPDHEPMAHGELRLP